MSDQLFQETPSPQNPQATPESANPVDPNSLFADKLSAITDETGRPKYGDLNTALDALKHSQAFIPTLQNEKRQLEEELARLKAEKEALERISEQAIKPQHQPESPAPAGLGAAEIEKLLESKLAATQQEALQKANLDKVQSTLVNTFGSGAKAKVAEVASANGLTLAELETLSKTKPQLVLNMFGGVAPSPRPTGGGHTFGNQPPSNELAKPTKSLLRGSTSKDIADYMKQVKAHVYTKYDIKQ